MADPTSLVSRTSEAIKARGIKGSLVAHDGRLFWRCTATTADGVRKSRRIRLELPAHPGQLVEAENRVIALSAAIAREGVLPDPLPWVKESIPITTKADAASSLLTVGEWCRELERDFWTGKVRTSAAERTWDRVWTELRRLPQHSSLTTDLLVAVASTTAAGSRTRLEACKVFKRLGKLAELQELERLDAIRTPYEPAERELPADEDLLNLLESTRGHGQYGWITAALVIYGCRPSEVFSLEPADDGTARVLTVKRKGKLPIWRTALALPPAWVEQFDLKSVSRPLEVKSPAQYDSLVAKRVTQAWGSWLGRQLKRQQLYNLRHAWAARSIRFSINASLAAKTMGHSLAVHHSTYHRWLEQSDVAAVAAALSSRF